MLRKLEPTHLDAGGASAGTRPSRWPAFLGLLLVCGCGGLPLLPEAPATFDLNGQWVVREAASDPPPNPERLRARADRGLLDLGVPGRPAAIGAWAFVVQDFPVLGAKSMVIEQDAHSMGIRYDSGHYRDISWGERRRGVWRVSAGWLEGALVIVSEAADADAKETMRLSADGRHLVVDISLKSAGDSFNAVRTYDRVSP